MNLLDYTSPNYEVSLYKGIPIGERHSTEIENLMSTGDYRIKYRGKSKLDWNRPRSYTVKRYADTFAIYEKNEVKKL